jgi:hypothetical protein
MAAVFLSDEEIEQLTEKKRHSTQQKILNALGISHKVRPNGTLVVLRSHVEKLLGGSVAAPAKKEPEPNWDALNGTRKKQ